MKTISLIVPAYNEEKNIAPLYEKLNTTVFQPLKDKYAFELVFVNDGSRDKTGMEIEKMAAKHPEIKFIDFSRNFGKEIATTAGINNCAGDACLMIDADLQHPAELIPQFIEKWEEGYEVVVGVRKNNAGHGLKTLGAKTFYAILNKISEVKVIPGATDFRLIDRAVIDEFNRFTESNRMTRALIDWLGFRRAYIYFDANERLNGEASYSLWKLTQLAGLLGIYILLGKYIFHWYFASISSNVVDLAVFTVFLVGIILISLGFISFYIANIQKEVIGRPMYVIRKKKV